MAEGCGANCAKILLIIFNFIFWLSGAAILAVGIWILVDKNFAHYYDILNTVDATGPLLKYAAYVLVGVGAFVFLVGFLGCCGAIKENRCLLGLYMMFMLLIMAGELAAGVLILAKKEPVKEGLIDSWKGAIKEKYGQSEEKAMAFTRAQDIFQIKLKCCGANNGYQDFKGSKWQTDHPSQEMPYSCCVLKKDAEKKQNITESDVVDVKKCMDAVTEGETVYYNKENCYKAAITWFDNHALILIGVGIGIACLELFGFIFAILLCRHATPSD